MAVIAFWPAIAVAARCTLPVAIRALALGGSTAMICLLLGTQSKGGAVALAVSAVVVFAVSRARLGCSCRRRSSQRSAHSRGAV